MEAPRGPGHIDPSQGQSNIPAPEPQQEKGWLGKLASLFSSGKSSSADAARMPSVTKGAIDTKVDSSMKAVSQQNLASAAESTALKAANLESLPKDIILDMMVKMPLKDIGRLRSTNRRLNKIGRDAITEKLNKENISLSDLGIKTNDQILRFLRSLGSENCARLKHLNLENTNIDANLLAELPLITPNLQSLNLSFCTTNLYGGLEYLNNLSQLESLDLSRCPKIHSYHFQHLGNLSQLKSLNLQASQLEGQDLQYLSTHLPNLQNLNLSLCRNITTPGFQHLANFSQLESLNLSNCEKFGGSGFKCLTNLSRLQNLDLSGCGIGNFGLERVSKLSLLRNLNLSNGKFVKDEGLQHLANLSQLQSLDLSNCELVSDSAKDLLKAAIPDLKIIE